MTDDLDSGTKASWDEFERRLRDRIRELEEDETYLVEVPQDEEATGSTPYVQFCAFGGGAMRCEAVSNHYLVDAWALDDAGSEQLMRVGFHAPTHGPGESPDSGSANYFVDVPREEVEDLAWMTVFALRDVYGVPHPSLLEAEDVVEPAPAPDVNVARSHADSEPEAFEAHLAQGPHELQELVDAALEPVFGHPPVKDPDGDIAVDTARGPVWVSVNGGRPVVDIWGIVLSDVNDRDLALHETAVLNRDHPDVKYVFHHGCIVAQTRVNASPFVPAHVRVALDQVCTAIERAQEDVLPRFRAASGTEEDDE